MCGCSDQRLLALISENSQKKNDNGVKVKIKVELEVEAEKKGRTFDETVPLVCLRTVMKDARTAELAVQKTILNVPSKIFFSRFIFIFFFKDNLLKSRMKLRLFSLLLHIF